MKEYRNYIFDLYGTLIDIHTDETSKRFWKAFREVFSSYGPQYDVNELERHLF